MKELDLLGSEQWSLGSPFGIEHPLLKVNSLIVMHTWIILGILLIITIPTRFILKKKGTIIHHVVTSFVSNFMDLCTQGMGFFKFNHFCFITSLFVFILLSNILSIIPYLEEPSADPNTTLALGIVTFIYTQIAQIASGGIGSYLKGYFQPFFIMLPLNIVGKIASIVSISFRLFGNIFGGTIIIMIYTSTIQKTFISQIFGLFITNFAIVPFFTLFEGFLQAFVFTMLALTYLGMALQGEGH